MKLYNCMNEILKPVVESSKTMTALGTQAKDKLMAQVRQEPAKTFSIILVGSILISVLLGYRISRMEEESKRQRLMEDWMREVTKWIGQHGQKIAGPIKGGLEATKSAVEEASNSGIRLGQNWQPFFEKQKRSFLKLF